jgi:hypothetical protein
MKIQSRKFCVLQISTLRFMPRFRHSLRVRVKKITPCLLQNLEYSSIYPTCGLQAAKNVVSAWRELTKNSVC